MHELSIAMSIVEMAQEEAEARGGVTIRVVHLKLGKMSGVVREALRSSYEMACCDTPLQGSELRIEEVPVEVFCAKCAAPQVLDSIQWFCCPQCGTPTPDVIRGKELEVTALEISE